MSADLWPGHQLAEGTGCGGLASGRLSVGDSPQH